MLFIKQNKGLVIVEYVLLLVTCVAIAMLINKVVYVGSNESSSGWFIKFWMSILTIIAEDM